ncbi:MAG: Sec-independent protein translocase protein TatB [Actinomycetota bacterium]|nr:Sec-independent protein translocase protein TatB [Actinomycetota bacterium]
MFNVGPFELLVLAVVGLILLGPERIPGLARDAARMIRTLRELATGARTQLRDELGPEFADVDLRNLNPRTAISRVILGDDAEKLTSFNPRNAARNVFFGDDEPAASATPVPGGPVSMEKMAMDQVAPPTPKPLGRGERAPFDLDAT